jgi:hypothetical protein
LPTVIHRQGRRLPPLTLGLRAFLKWVAVLLQVPRLPWAVAAA